QRRAQVLDGRVAPPQTQVEVSASTSDLDLVRLGNGVGRLNRDGVQPRRERDHRRHAPMGLIVHQQTGTTRCTCGDLQLTVYTWVGGEYCWFRRPGQPAKACATRQKQQDTDQDEQLRPARPTKGDTNGQRVEELTHEWRQCPGWPLAENL